jgi:cell wall-associated NlpC family hydrolase
MTWDGTAIAVATKAIGEVECNMNYGAVSTSDSITIGIFQWYGTRAANLLFQIQSGASASFTAHCPSTISADMSSHPATDSWWNYRHVTSAEVRGLYDLLTQTDVIAIQDAQASTDLAAYIVAGQNWGLDKDNETEAMEFFCNIYNQSPKAAMEICGVIPAQCSLHDIYAATLNNWIGQSYKTRYDRAYNYVLNQDTAGVTVNAGNPPDPNGTPNGATNGINPSGDSNGVNDQGVQTTGLAGTVITPYGGSFVAYPPKGNKVLLLKSSADNHFIPSDSNSGAAYTNPVTSVPTPIPPVHTAPGGQTGTASAAATAIINWERSKLGVYAYSQAAGRQNPTVSGFCDCSSLQAYAFQTYANVDLGGIYVGAQWPNGQLISTDISAIRAETGLQPGDLIFFRWHPTTVNSVATGGIHGYDHVGIYTGSTLISQKGHNTGYPNDYGPTEEPWTYQIDYVISNGGACRVNRYLT